jgi:hypothetical protein
MVAISDHPTGAAPAASFGIAIPSQPVTNTLPGPTHIPTFGHNANFSHFPSYGPSNFMVQQSFSMQNVPAAACSGMMARCGAAPFSSSLSARPQSQHVMYGGPSSRSQHVARSKGAFAPPPHAASFGLASVSFGAMASCGADPLPLDDSRLVSRQAYLEKRDVKTLRELTADLGDDEMFFCAGAKLTAKEVKDVQYKKEVLELAHARSLSAASFGAAPVPLCPPPPQDDSFGTSLLGSGTKKTKVFATDPSLLDVLGALQSASWDLRHPVVAAFLNKHLPMTDALLTSDAHATVAVIVVLRVKFKDSKAGWQAHVKRAALSARRTLGDSAYASLKESLVRAISA